jgi:hypothetical protein
MPAGYASLVSQNADSPQSLVSEATVNAPRRHRFTEADFDRMAETGILYEAPGFELIDGDILEITGSPPD